jgi:hypothetical protein
MRFMSLMTIIFVAGCAATYKQPTTITQETSKKLVESPSDILRAAKQVLVSEGFQITNTDESAGIISTALRNFRLTPEQADCGTTMGIDYLKDNRTSSKLGYGILLSNGKLTIKANIESEYKPGAVDQDITLTCVSRGTLEPMLLDKIITALHSK